MIRPLKSRRSLAVTAVLGLALIVPSMAQALEDQVQVRGAGLSSAQVKVTLSDIGSPSSYSYTINGSTQSLSGYTLRQVLDEADGQSSSLQVSKATSVNIPRPTNGFVAIAKSDFSQGPPLFYEEDGTMKFVDPTGPRILTYSFSIPAVELVQSKQSVGIGANPANGSKAGEKVTFAAQSNGAASGESITYSWKFGDGSTGSGPNPNHTFAKKGSFDVTVTATGTAGFSQTDTLNYQVDPKKSKKKQKGGGDDKDGDQTGTDTNTDPGYSTPYSGSTYGTGVPGGSYPSPAAPAGPSSTPAPQNEEPVVPPDDGLIAVTGELVSSSAPAVTSPPGEAPAEDSLQEGTPEEPQKAGINDGVWVFLGLMALFALGGLAEKRGSRLR